jgi:hypothetical protein
MLHKIRQAMRKRDAEYTLVGIRKRSRGTNKIKILVGLSLTKNGNPLYQKMEIVTNIKGKTLVDFVKKIQTIYIGCILSFLMRKHLLVERSTGLIHSISKPI